MTTALRTPCQVRHETPCQPPDRKGDCPVDSRPVRTPRPCGGRGGQALARTAPIVPRLPGWRGLRLPRAGRRGTICRRTNRAGRRERRCAKACRLLPSVSSYGGRLIPSPTPAAPPAMSATKPCASPRAEKATVQWTVARSGRPPPLRRAWGASACPPPAIVPRLPGWRGLRACQGQAGAARFVDGQIVREGGKGAASSRRRATYRPPVDGVTSVSKPRAKASAERSRLHTAQPTPTQERARPRQRFCQTSKVRGVEGCPLPSKPSRTDDLWQPQRCARHLRRTRRRCLAACPTREHPFDDLHRHQRGSFHGICATYHFRPHNSAAAAAALERIRW